MNSDCEYAMILLSSGMNPKAVSLPSHTFGEEVMLMAIRITVNVSRRGIRVTVSIPKKQKPLKAGS